MKIAINTLREQLEQILTKNISEQDAAKLAEYFVWAEMSGNKTQGIVKFTGPEPVQVVKPEGPVVIERETKLSQLLNAAKNPAPLVTIQATEVAIAKAKEHGFGIVGVHNFFSSNGVQGYYAQKIAEADLIGICMSRSPAAVAGFGSIAPIFGTNPIGFGMPTNDQPVVFDMATSAMTFYGLVLAKARGETIPEGMAIDKDGNPTTDPDAAINGALLSFDRSYKGSELGLLVETLAGPLVSSAWIDNVTLKEEWGAVVIAIDPELLVDSVQFKRNASDMLVKIRSARTKNGIRLPGESSYRKRQAALASGMIEIDDVIADKLGIRTK